MISIFNNPASEIMYIFLGMLQREYFKQGKVDQFRQILEEGSSPGILSLYFIDFGTHSFKLAVELMGLVYQPVCICYCLILAIQFNKSNCVDFFYSFCRN